MSTDGRYVVFTSSRMVVPGQIDSNGEEDVFLLDRQTGITKLVSHAAGSLLRTGNWRSGLCSGPGAVISSDGRFVAFCSSASNLVAGVQVGGDHIYLYSRLDESITLVDHLPGAPTTAADPQGWHDGLAISGDGSHVAFKSTSMALVGGVTPPPEIAGEQVFLFERASGLVRLVSHTTRSETTPGYSTNPGPSGLSLSLDGTRVAFAAEANLLSDAGEQMPTQVYLYRLEDRSVSLVSHAAGALGPANDSSSLPTISGDGRFVAYSSRATDLVAGFPSGSPGALNVFLHSVSEGTNQLVTRAADAKVMGGNYDSNVGGLSTDGSFVALESRATNLVAGFQAGGTPNIFLYSRLDGSMALVSHRVGSTVAAANSSSTSSLLSADGGLVAFLSWANNLVPGVDDSAGDLFLFDRTTLQVTLVSHRLGDADAAAGASRDGLAMSGDGRAIAFTSWASDITAVPDRNYESDVFVFDRTASSIVLASGGPSGSPSITSIMESGFGWAPAHSMTTDGRYVLFESMAPDLVPGQVDPYGTPDVFVHDRVTAETRLVTHAPGLPATSIGAYHEQPVISADGSSVAYVRYGCVYVWSRESDSTEPPINVPIFPEVTPLPCEGQVYFPSISGDGNRVVFAKYLAVAGLGYRWQVYVWSRGEGVRLVSHAPGQATVPGNGDSGMNGLRISRDGRYVAFSSNAKNLYGPGGPAPGPSDWGEEKVFLYSLESDSIRLVSHSAASTATPLGGWSVPSAVSSNGAVVTFQNSPTPYSFLGGQQFLYRTATEEVTLVSHRFGSPLEGSNGQFGGFGSFYSAVSDDGSYVAFHSDATDLVEGTDLNGSFDVFLYSTRDGSIRLVSHEPGEPTRAAGGLLSYGGQSLSADGTILTFSGPDVTGGVGTSAIYQAFVYDTVRDEVTLASRSRLGGAMPADGHSIPIVSNDGRWVAFTSLATDLVEGDLNSQRDVFLFGPTRPGADLSVGMAAPAAFTPGTTTSLTAVIVNLGPETSRGVNLTLSAPAGLGLIATTGACTSWPCDIGTLGSGQFSAVTLTFAIPSDYTAPDPAVIRVTATATTPDLGSANDVGEAAVAVLPEADLELRLSGPPSATPPHQLTYTLTVTNRGPSDAVAVQLDDPTPAGLAFLSGGGDCPGGFPCVLGSLAPGGSRTVTAVFALPDTYSGPDPIHNAASASSSTGDANPANNGASVYTILDVATPPLGYYTVVPCRLLDTRQPSGPTAGTPLEGGVERWFAAAGSCAIPSTARAVVVNATVTGADGSGNVRLWAAGKPVPTASVVSYSAGQTRGVNAVVGLNTFGTLAVMVAGSPHVHLILDVSGYFE